MLLKPLQIGPYTLRNNLVLAPMAGVTDRPFRQLCRSLGAGMAVSEMLSANPALWQSKKSLLRANHQGETLPRSVQIAGADPHTMALAAKHNADAGAQIIDINLGCPAKKVCQVMAGSALMENVPLVAQILEAVVAAVDIPVTLKMRTGWDRAHKNGLEVAKIAEQSGIQALAVHGRTRADRYQGAAEYDTIAHIKHSVRIPVLANGDIDSPQKAHAVLTHTGADGIMIGRAAQGNPWIFAQIAHFLQHGSDYPAPSLETIEHTLVGHLEALYQFYGPYTGVRVARKHIAWYSKGLPHGEAFRQAINPLEASSEQLALCRAFFESLRQDAQAA